MNGKPSTLLRRLCDEQAELITVLRTLGTPWPDVHRICRRVVLARLAPCPEIPDGPRPERRWHDGLYLTDEDIDESANDIAKELKMPKVSDMVPSKYFRMADFEGGRTERLTIAEVRSEEMGDGESKWVVFFDEDRHGLVLNKTNILTLGELFGEQTDDWIEQTIELYKGTVKGKSGSVAALLVREPRAPRVKPEKAAAARPAGKPAEPMTQAEADASDDDMPF